METQVDQAVEAWIRWVPRWEPATHRGRVAPCRRCLGSPILSAAGIGSNTPHGVQHGLSTRIKTIVDHAVADYTSRNLPMLQRELDQQAARNRARSYRPAENLDPEFDGLPLDPEPIAGAPFLFTIAGMADEYANMVGREICRILLRHRIYIQAAISQHVEPQIEALLAELTESLDSPFDSDQA